MRNADALLGYLEAVRRWWVVVVATALIGMLAGFLSAPRASGEEEPTDTASSADGTTFDPSAGPFRATHLLVRTRTTTLTQNLDLVAVLAADGEVPVRVAEQLGRPGEALQVASQITVSVDQALGTVALQTTQLTPDGAEEFASTYAETLVDYINETDAADRQRQLAAARARLDVLEQQVAELEERIAAGLEVTRESLAQADLAALINDYTTTAATVREIEVAAESGQSAFETLQAPVAVPASGDTSEDARLPVPTLPAEPTTRGLVLRTLMGGFLGFLVGLGLALLADRFDTRVRTAADAEEAFGLPVLGRLPATDGDGELVQTDLDHTVAHHALAVAIRVSPRWHLGSNGPTGDGDVGNVVGTARELDAGGSAVRTILVTAAGHGAGASTTVTNLAAAYAAADLDVLVVDCSFRSPALHQLLADPSAPGIRDGGDLSGIASLVQPSTIPGVRVLPAGAPGPAPASLLTDGHWFVDRVRELADVVVIDTGPLLVSDEASSLVGAVDAVLLVSQLDRTIASSARLATERLARLHAIVSGVAVVTGTPSWLGAVGSLQSGGGAPPAGPAVPPPAHRQVDARPADDAEQVRTDAPRTDDAVYRVQRRPPGGPPVGGQDGARPPASAPGPRHDEAPGPHRDGVDAEAPASGRPAGGRTSTATMEGPGDREPRSDDAPETTGTSGAETGREDGGLSSLPPPVWHRGPRRPER